MNSHADAVEPNYDLGWVSIVILLKEVGTAPFLYILRPPEYRPYPQILAHYQSQCYHRGMSGKFRQFQHISFPYAVETKTIPASQPSTMYIAVVLCLLRQFSGTRLIQPFNIRLGSNSRVMDSRRSFVREGSRDSSPPFKKPRAADGEGTMLFPS
jgi:hypothetical protein